jgi:hypothetical protein
VMNDPSPAFASRIASTYFLDSNLPKAHMGYAACSREMVRPSFSGWLDAVRKS